ncbi:MAG: hypothetical protein J6R99_01790 [Alphaproteobacteria bacterium]|nr:hypothetical protein [Alphaproteobacteria bacterium]
MTSKLKCPWCGSNMMYSVLGQNLTSSHFCDNVDCKAFQMVLPDNLWKDIFAWNQSQRDLDCAKQALVEIRFCNSCGFDVPPQTPWEIKAHNALAQIGKNNE